MPGTIKLLISGVLLESKPYGNKLELRGIMNNWRKEYDFEATPGEVIIQPRIHSFQYLDDEICETIRKLYLTGNWTLAMLGQRYSCSQSTVGKVIKSTD